MSDEGRFGFAKGMRVVATERAFRNGVFKRKDAPVVGTVRGFPRSSLGIIVQRDNRKRTSSYHIDFWRPSTPESK